MSNVSSCDGSEVRLKEEELTELWAWSSEGGALRETRRMSEEGKYSNVSQQKQKINEKSKNLTQISAS